MAEHHRHHHHPRRITQAETDGLLAAAEGLALWVDPDHFTDDARRLETLEAKEEERA